MLRSSKYPAAVLPQNEVFQRSVHSHNQYNNYNKIEKEMLVDLSRNTKQEKSDNKPSIFVRVASFLHCC